MDNVTYQVNLDYDVIGRLGSITYPKMPGPEPRFKVNYGYKPNGDLAQVTDASTSALYWRVDSRDAAGLLTNQTYGNLAYEDRTYDTIGLLDTITTFAPGGQQIARVSHEFDQNRNLAVIEEDMVIGAVLHEFRHDRLNRLTEWQFWTYDGGEDWDQDFAKHFNYNKNGNLDSETGARPGTDATFQYGQLGAPPHALTTRNGQTYTYDAAGRQITAPGRTVSYTTFNSLVESLGATTRRPTSPMTRRVGGSASETGPSRRSRWRTCSSVASQAQRSRTSTTSWPPAAPSLR